MKQILNKEIATLAELVAATENLEPTDPKLVAAINEVPAAANTDITSPLRIISDYMQRFLSNNKDAKLYEAKDRLERKIIQFTSDGYDERCLRQALSTATSCHTREAFIGALQKMTSPQQPVKHLIIMACSATKSRAAAPAMDLYKGVMYSTFRANVPAIRPAIVILSAKHGFIEADRVIEPYEQRMTEARADEMIAELPDLDSIRWPAGVHSILLAGGKTYQRVMRAAIKRRIELGLLDNGIIIEQTSGGIGYQRAQLGAYLRSLPNSNVNHDKVTANTTMHIKGRAMSNQLDAQAEQDTAAEGCNPKEVLIINGLGHKPGNGKSVPFQMQEKSDRATAEGQE